MSTNFGVQYSPTQIYFGRGAVSTLTEVVGRFGRKALIVVDPYFAATSTFDHIASELRSGGIELRVVSDFTPELPAPEVEAIAARAREGDPDVVVGFGGGSALDLAKAIAVLLSYPAPISQFYGESAVPGEVLPVVAVPTTAGTGSEVTPVSVITDPDRLLKVGISDRRIVPRAAIVDPDLTDTAPAGVTAAAGADALVHALEAATARAQQPWKSPVPVFVGRNTLSTEYAMQAVALLIDALPRVVADGGDRDARTRMAYGSLLAGIAFGSAGTHLSHALQYPIGALTKTPHGVGTGILAPYVLQACRRAAQGPLADIAGRIGFSGVSAAMASQFVVDRVERVMRDAGLPRTIAQIGVKADDLDGIAEAALTVKRLVENSPIRMTRDSLRVILEAAHSGDIASLEDHPFDQYKDTEWHT